MKSRYLSFFIPLFLALGGHELGNGELPPYRILCDSHPSFSAKPYGNRIECYEGGIPGVTMLLESSLGNEVYGIQIPKAGSCSQCHPTEKPVHGKALMNLAEKN